MMGQFEIFRVGRVPVYLDFMFVLLAAMFSWGYWTDGSAFGMSAGFVLMVGLFVSVLLHELGHAWAGQYFGVGTRAIELSGLGGICIFDRSLPAKVVPLTVIGLAGPFANLVLWKAFGYAAAAASGAGGGMLAIVLGQLAFANLLLLIYNLLPAFPLDGGKVLEAWLSPLSGPQWAVRVVAVLGLGVALWLAYMAFPGGLFMLLMAALLAMHNWEKLQSVGGIGKR